MSNQLDHEAVYALHPNIQTIDCYGVATDKNGSVVSYDINAVNNLVAANEYKSKRQAEYPSIGDQLDALWKGGDTAKAMLAQIQAVKTKYPKPE